MQDFEAIRPYQDEEVPGVIARLIRDPGLRRAAARFLLPHLSGPMPRFADWLIGIILERKTRNMKTVAEVQEFLEGYMRRIIETTIHELSVSGLEDLPAGRPYLFISNHRDIVLDSGILNYVIYHAGHETARMAVGDNLLTEPFAADLMRLNKSFVVERSASGRRAMYNAMLRTSSYIRYSLQQGHSVWIAQRAGRAKDGFDRTEPALLKMLALAWREDMTCFADLLKLVAIVPVSISYELDPCDRDKARELAAKDRDGQYHKLPGEDLSSIVRGLTGFKGRMHLHFSPVVSGEPEDADALALMIDRAIVGGLRVFPTQAAAAEEMGLGNVPDAGDWLPEVRNIYVDSLAACPEKERDRLLSGYGNLIRNRNELLGQPR
jgi:hypothetical protein